MTHGAGAHGGGPNAGGLQRARVSLSLEEHVQGEDGRHGHSFKTRAFCFSGNTYKSRQRARIPGFYLQRFVEQMITEVLLAHVLHGIEVLEEPLLAEGKHCVSAAAAGGRRSEGAAITTHPDVTVHSQAVGLVLVLLDFPRDLGHLPPLAKVDKVFAVAQQEVRIAFFRL